MLTATCARCARPLRRPLLNAPCVPEVHLPPQLLRGTDILPALAVALGPDMLPQLATTPMTA